MSLRILGGSHKNREIVTARVRGVRPTKSVVREAIFDVIEHRYFPLNECSVIDAFAGSGSLGFEALSRGAKHVTFIERDTTILRQLHLNVERFGVSDSCSVLRRDATKIGRLKANASLEAGSDNLARLVFLDPPYQRHGLVSQVVDALIDGEWLDETALFIIETSTENESLELPRCNIDSRRIFGGSAIFFARRSL